MAGNAPLTLTVSFSLILMGGLDHVYTMPQAVGMIVQWLTMASMTRWKNFTTCTNATANDIFPQGISQLFGGSVK